VPSNFFWYLVCRQVKRVENHCFTEAQYSPLKASLMDFILLRNPFFIILSKFGNPVFEFGDPLFEKR
jgi:hypothetical protein